MRIDLLKTLYAYTLVNATKDNFDIGNYDFNGKKCLMGFAMQVPEFIEMGLERLSTGAASIPMFNRKFGILAAMEFFEISMNDAVNLFISKYGVKNNCLKYYLNNFKNFIQKSETYTIKEIE